MKRHTPLLLFTAMILALSSCKTSQTSMQILVPAQIDVPQSIQSVGVANRSLPGKGNTFGNIVEGLFSGEAVFADKEGSERCLAGISAKLNEAPRFSAATLHGAGLTGTGTKKFAPPLDWGEVNKLCKQYNVDALVVLESFDSDTYIDKSQRKVKRKIDDREVMVTEYLADMTITVNSGWRIYDNTSKRIVDENVYTDQKSWDSKGDSPEEAMRRLPSKRSAINETGYFSGAQYAIRISPTWMNASRSYYIKGSDPMKEAKSYVKTGNWDGAIEIWKKEVQNPDPEVAGRACYNMAVASEMKGNLNLALEWANKALRKYNNKKASSYISVLNRRLADQRRLDTQLGE